MSNPFDQNPWQSSGQQSQGPRYGNAYESDINPPYGNAYEQPSNTYQQPTNYTQQNNTMPPFSATGYNNAWGDESNKTEYNNTGNSWSNSPAPAHVQQQSPYSTPNSAQQPLAGPQDAYQYTGTPYGNQAQQTGSAYSAAAPSPQPEHQQPNKSNESVGPDPWNGEIYHTPNKWRFWFRFILLLASIGHLGFAAGARPYSGEDVPFSTSACFYYLFAVAVLSIIWSAYHVFFYCYRRMLKKPKTNRPIMFALDLLMAVLWGIGVIVEVVKFKCTDGGKFCTFYNVSIFWGFLAFAAYILAVIWDVYGACCAGRRKK